MAGYSPASEFVSASSVDFSVGTKTAIYYTSDGDSDLYCNSDADYGFCFDCGSDFANPIASAS